MDLHTLLSFDPYDQFDDIPQPPSTANINQIDNLPKLDELLSSWSSSDVDTSPNNWSEMMSNHPVTTIDSRSQRYSFDAFGTDNRVEHMIIDGTLHINLQSPRIDDWTLPWENPFEGTQTNSSIRVSSPVDNCFSQPYPYNPVGLHYQPRTTSPFMSTSSAYGFGSVQLASYTPEMQLPAMSYDIEMPMMKKPGKRKQSRPSKMPSLDLPDVNEWYVRDENGRRRRPLLYEFLRQLLNDENYADIAGFVDKQRGIFKFYQREKAAQLWGFIKGRNGTSSKFLSIIICINISILLEMNYDKFARGIRYYYSTEVIHPTPGRFTFRFGSPSGFGTTWMAN